MFDAKEIDFTKIEADPANPVFILTRRGAGYYFQKDT